MKTTKKYRYDKGYRLTECPTPETAHCIDALSDMIVPPLLWLHIFSL